MKIFYLTFSQMLTMFTFIILGYALRKTRILPEISDLTMSLLEMYIFVPALTFSTFMTKCTVITLKENSVLILYGLILVAVAMLLSYPLSKLFIRNTDNDIGLDYQRNIYKYAMTFGNYGFMGNFIILGVWGSDVFFKYSMLTLCVGLLCSSWGLFILIPKGAREKGTFNDILKRVLTPPMIALVNGVFAGLLNVKDYVPEFFKTVLSNSSACMGPVAMLLAGFVMGGYDFKRLLTNKKVYVATFFRLIVIPAIMVLILRFIGTSKEVMTLVLIAFATPLGLNTIVYPAAYGGDTSTGASMAMISHTLSVVTIPLMYLVFIVLM